MTPDNKLIYHAVEGTSSYRPISNSVVVRRVVKFDLPFMILVDDSFQDADNGMGFVEINTPFVVSVLSYSIILRFKKKVVATSVVSPEKQGVIKKNSLIILARIRVILQ